MADLEFKDLLNAEQISTNDILGGQRDLGEGLYGSRKFTFGAIGLFLNKVLHYASDLHTTSKTIIGAINEVHDNSTSPALDDLSDVDIDEQTLVDGQGIVYDATSQKWKNGMVGGGHTYSTTEQVVGTWIDGSPVYEKTYSTSIASGETYVNIPFSDITNLSSVISLEGFFDNQIPFTLNGAINCIPNGSKHFFVESLNQYEEYGYISSTGVRVRRNSSNEYSSTPPVYLTIRYLKTAS